MADAVIMAGDRWRDYWKFVGGEEIVGGGWELPSPNWGAIKNVFVL